MNPSQAAIAFIEALAEATPALLKLWQAAGGSRSAFLTALDSALEVARAKTDTDLDAKHRG